MDRKHCLVTGANRVTRRDEEQAERIAEKKDDAA